MKIKKSTIRITALILSLLLGLCSCGNTGATTDDSSKQSSTQPSSHSSEPSYDPSTAVELDGKIISDGRSEYKIVVSGDADQMETYAANELSGFLYNATGVVLPVISDESINDDFSGKYISVGDTSLCRKSGLTLDRATYTRDGYRIITRDNTVILRGQSDYGTLYSVYGFLKYTIGYHAYSPDELYYEKKDEIPLMDFNVTDIPDFEGRADNSYLVGERTLAKDAARMGMYAGWQMGYTIFGGKVFGTSIHSARVLVPKDKYPELWEASKGAQVCVTTEHAFEVWLENLKQAIIDNPNSSSFQIGLEDTSGHCPCPSCKKEAAEHGGYGGVMIRFLNRLSDELKPWLQEVLSGREIDLIGLAYYAWDAPPVKEDANGNVVPYDETVVARDNVGIMYAPIESCFAHSMGDCTATVKHAEKLRGWGKITNKIQIYSYPIIYYNYFLPQNDWGARQGSLKFYKEIGVNYFYDQGPGSTYNPMQALKVYLNSQLLWKVDQNVDDLIDDFMVHYYRTAAPYIRRYYDLTRAHYAKLDREGIWTHIGIGATSNRTSSTEWPYAYCAQAMKCFEDARKAVEESNLDAKTKEKVLIRVDRDSTAVRYLILENYPDYYTKNEFNSLVDEFVSICNLGGINEKSEFGEKISDLATVWKKL